MLGPGAASIRAQIRAAAPRTIVVGDDRDYPPYSFMQNGQPAGFLVDLMQAVGRLAGMTIEHRLGPWAQVRADLEAGRLDAIGGLCYSPERDERADFTAPHSVIVQDLFVRADAPFRSLEDLRGRAILVQEGGLLHEFFLREDFAGHIETVPDVSTLILAISTGAQDAAAVNLVQGSYYARQLGVTNLRAVHARLVPQPYCIAVREGDELLRDTLNAALTALKGTPEYRALHEKWFGAYEPPVAGVWPVIQRFFWIPAGLLLLLSASSVGSWLLQRTVRRRTRELERARSELEDRGRVLAGVAEMGAYLLGEPELDAGIREGLGLLGRAARVDRVFVTQELAPPSPGRETAGIRWEWSASEEPAPPAAVSPEWRDALASGRVAQGPLPPPAPDAGDEGAVYRLMVPVSIGSEVWGVIGFDTVGRMRRWQPTEIDALRTAAAAIGATLLRDRDETALRKSEQREHHAAGRWHTLLDAVPALVWIAMDRECRRITGNRMANRLVGIDPASNASLTAPDAADLPPFRIFKDGVELKGDQLPMQQAARAGVEFRDFEEEMVLADGTRRTLLGNVVPLPDAEGRPDGAVAAFIDITDLKRAAEEKQHLERQILQAQKLESLGVLAGGIAHDFNNLLTMVLGNANLARTAMAPSSPAAGHLAEIEKASRRAAELCRQMLAYSGKGRFVSERLNLSEVVEDMAHMLEISVSKKAVLKYEFAHDLPAVEADPTQLRQVIMNLIINASEAIGDRSGFIRVSTGQADLRREDLAGSLHGEEVREGTYVYLEVEDTGCGMDDETTRRIFEPFYSTKFMGRGLGLSAVLGIVRAHAGVLRVRSVPGHGTTFRVLFPAGAAAMPAEPAEADDADAWRGQGTVLLADDEEGIRLIGRRILEQLGFTVVVAAHGRETVERFRQDPKRWRCVLLDLTMPEMDGMEAFREIHRIRPDVPVLLTSGYDEKDVQRRYGSASFAGFIQKPFEMSMLRARLRSVLGGTPAPGPTPAA